MWLKDMDRDQINETLCSHFMVDLVFSAIALLRKDIAYSKTRFSNLSDVSAVLISCICCFASILSRWRHLRLSASFKETEVSFSLVCGPTGKLSLQRNIHESVVFNDI